MKTKMKNLIKNYYILILFFVALVVFMLRSSFVLNHPSFYAEDGIWTGLIFNKGAIWTILNARQDYYPITIVLMIDLAKHLSAIFFGNDISTIPVFLYFISCVFYSLVAILPVITLKKRLNKYARLFIYLGILLLPLGTSTTEVLGRTLQTHFYIWIITLCLLIYRYDHKTTNKFNIFIIDIALILLVPTFPSVLLIYGTYGLIEIYNIIYNYYFYNRGYKEKRITLAKTKEMFICELSKFHIKSLLISAFIILIFALKIFIRMKNSSMDFGSGMSSNIIEIIVRTFIFPIVYGIYNNLNNQISLLIIIAFILFLVAGYFTIKKESRNFYIILLLAYLSIGVITITTRSSITLFLNNYQTSYPDRYYMLTNAMMFFPIGVIISDWLIQSRQGLKIFAMLIIFSVLFIAVFNYKKIFRLEKNDLPWITERDFKSQIIDSYNSDNRTNDGNYYIIEIDPEWEMSLPVKVVDDFIKLKN